MLVVRPEPLKGIKDFIDITKKTLKVPDEFAREYEKAYNYFY
jgi:hypothetical protein